MKKFEITYKVNPYIRNIVVIDADNRMEAVLKVESTIGTKAFIVGVVELPTIQEETSRQVEMEAIQQIQSILDTLDPESGVVKAFKGCVADALHNVNFNRSYSANDEVVALNKTKDALAKEIIHLHERIARG